MQIRLLTDYACPPQPTLGPGALLHVGTPEGRDLIMQGIAEQVFDTESLKTAMTELWDTLPLPAQVVFYPLKIAVNIAINEGRFALVPGLIDAVECPPELVPVKQGMLALLSKAAP